MPTETTVYGDIFQSPRSLHEKNISANDTSAQVILVYILILKRKQEYDIMNFEDKNMYRGAFPNDKSHTHYGA